MSTPTDLLEKLQALAPEIVALEKNNRPGISLKPEHWLKVASALLSDSQFLFDMLCDHSAIDWGNGQEIELIYQFYSTQKNCNLSVSIKIDRNEPRIESVSSLWPIAEWQEREVFDLFGVKYLNHPDLRRIFLDDDWQGYPLLKDYKDSFMLDRPW